MGHVILARPDQLHRRCDRLRRLDRGGNEIDIQPAAESAAEQGGVDVDLVGLHPGRGRRRFLRHLLDLSPHVQVAAIRFDVGGAIHRLHGRVRQQRQFVDRFERALRRFERGRGVAVLARHETLVGGGGLLEQAPYRRIVEARIGPRFPGDPQRIACLKRLPEMIRHHDHPVGGGQHPAYSRHGQGPRRIDRHGLAPQGGTLRQGRIQHPRQFDVQAEFGAAVHFARRIEPRRPGSDQPEGGFGLELDLLGDRHLGGNAREFAIAETLALSVRHHAVTGMALRRIHPPRLGRGRNQHGAGGCTGNAQLLPRILHAVAGAGDLAAIEGVDVRIADRRRDDVDPRQIDFELLGQQHGQRGVHALSHFRAVDDDGDRIVRRNLEPRIQLPAGRRVSRPGTSAKGRQRQRQHQPAAGRRRALAEIAAARVADGALKTADPAAATTRSRDVSPCGFAGRYRNGRCYRPWRRRSRHRSASNCS